MAVNAKQRFKRDHPCPVCGGFDDQARGTGERCYGFLCDDGQWANCTRPEWAGPLTLNAKSESYTHILKGDCRCGKSHCGPTEPVKALSSNGASRVRPEGKQTRFQICDGEGRLVAVHVRLDGIDGKKLWWEQPNGSNGLNGTLVVDLPLYGAELSSRLSDGASELLTEGEPAANALRTIGIVCSATITGAGAIPSDEQLMPLVRLKVVLWPDNDDVGRHHMDRIAARLKVLGCSEVRVVSWTKAPEKGDAADAVAQGVDVARLIAEASEWEPAEDVDELGEDEVTLGSSPKIASRLLKLAQDSGAKFFQDAESGDFFVASNGDGTRVWRLDGQDAARWLARLWLKAEGSPVAPDAIKAALFTLSALVDDSIPLDVRVAWGDGKLWYDLGGAAGQVDATGWKVVEEPPILFKRFPHQLPQMRPSHPGDFSRLDGYLPVDPASDEALLLKVWLLAGMS